MSTAIDALLDSNVVVALLVSDHMHHAASLRLLIRAAPMRLAVAAHCYAEVYSTLTRRSTAFSFQFEPQEAWAALERLATMTQLVGLTPAQGFDVVRSYARSGGVGPRLYDRLIGEAGLANGIDTIVTWNLSHMRGLFPQMTVVAPPDLAA